MPDVAACVEGPDAGLSGSGVVVPGHCHVSVVRACVSGAGREGCFATAGEGVAAEVAVCVRACARVCVCVVGVGGDGGDEG